MSNEEAIRHYQQTGEHLGIFKTPDAATAYAKSLHEQQAQEYGKPMSVNNLMPALIQQESGGNGMAVSPAGALGSTQMLPATAQEMAGKLGLPWRPDLLRSNDPSALDYQRRLGAAYLQEGLQRTGNVRDALRYYHGGPNRAQWGPKTNAYADAILSRLGGL